MESAQPALSGPPRALIWVAVSSEKQAGDKISLGEQERAARAWCVEHGYDVVGVLTVPGESRSDTDVLTIFEEFSEKGIYAYHDLRRMWQPPRQFDVLVAYHDSRLGRSESLFAFVVTNVMRAGAKIYCILGGWYEPKDYRMKMLIGMYTVSSEMDRFVQLTRATKHAKAEDGTLVHGPKAFFQVIERDEKGQPLRKVPDESKRQVIEDAARLVIEGAGWKQVERQLYERYGHTNRGKPFTRYTFYYMFQNPNFWGNEVIHVGAMVSKKGGNKYRRPDLWVFDPTYPHPPDTRVLYGVLEPYLAPESTLSHQLQSELRRRRLSIRGSARPRNSHKFTGLLVCYYCGRNLVYHPLRGRTGTGYIYSAYTCHSKYNSAQPDRCTKTRSISEKRVLAWVDNELREAITANDAEWFVRRPDEQQRDQQLELMKQRADQLSQQIDRAIDEQLSTDDDNIRRRMRTRITDLSNALSELERQIVVLEHQQTYDHSGVYTAYQRLIEFPDLEAFWNAGDNLVNQLLHGLMGSVRLVVRDQEIRGDTELPR